MRNNKYCMHSSIKILECNGTFLFKDYYGYFRCAQYLCNADRERMGGNRKDLFCDFKDLDKKQVIELLEELTSDIKELLF